MKQAGVAGELICERYTPLVRAAATRYRGGWLTEEDLIQEGYLALILALREYQEERGVFLPYFLRQRVHGHLYSLVRAERRRRQREVFLAGANKSGEEGPDPAANLPDARAMDPAETVVEAESFAKLLCGLPPRQGQVLQLIYGAGLSGRAAARRLGISEQAVSDAHRRALDRLKKEIKGL